MKAGANQQLVATKLEEPKPLPQEPGVAPEKLDELVKESKPVDGSLQVAHKPPTETATPSKSLSDLEQEVANDTDNNETEDDLARIHIDSDGRLRQLAELNAQNSQPTNPAGLTQKAPDGSNEMIMQPPSLGGALTANTTPDTGSSGVNPLVIPTESQVPDYREVQHGKAIQPINGNLNNNPQIADPNQSLTDLEKSVGSPHAEAARKAVADAVASQPPKIEPIQALNAHPIELGSQPATSTIQPSTTATPAQTPNDNTVESVFPPQLIKPDVGLAPEPTAGSANPSAPPPVPPPLMPPSV